MRGAGLLVFCGLGLTACGRRAEVAIPGSGELPLRLLADGYYVKVGLEHGKSGLFLVDTGSYRSSVTKKGEGVLGDAGVLVGAGDQFIAKGASVEGYPVGTLRFTPSGFDQAWFDPRADGVLGLDFLKGYTVGFDLKRRVMRLWPNEAGVGKEPAAWLRSIGGAKPSSELDMLPGRGLYSVPVKLDGREIQLVPDTGAADIVVCRRDAASWDLGKPGRSVRGSFYDGDVTMDEYQIGRVDLGAISEVRRQPVHVPRSRDTVNLIGR